MNCSTPQRRRRPALPTLALVALIHVLTAWMIPPPPASAADSEQSITVAFDVAEVTVQPFACWTALFNVQLTNTGSEAVYVDVWIEASGPVEVSRELVSTYVPAGWTVDAPLRASVPPENEPGRWTVTASTGGSEAELAVDQPTDTGDNHARTADVSASSEHSSGYVACHAADGNTNSEQWTDTVWFDRTGGVWPDWIQFDLEQATSVSRVELYTLDSEEYPAADLGLSDYDIELRVGEEWTTVAEIRGNVEGKVVTEFAPTEATAVRILCHAANDDLYARIIELEIYS